MANENSRMKLEPGDLIVDHCGVEAESPDGIMLAITPDLIVENLDAFLTPCQVHRLHRQGLQCQRFADRLTACDCPRELELYRLTLWERFTPFGANAFEAYVRGVIRDLPPLAVIPSAVAIARILMHAGKLPRYAPDYTTVSILISDLVVLGVYENLSEPKKLEALSLPAAAAA